MKLLVTHPGRQHSHRAALALDGAGLLAGYWSGVPAAAAETAGLPGFLRRRLAGYTPVALPPARVRSFLLTPALRRAGDALLPHAAAARLDLAACRLFDRWAAAGLARAARGTDLAAVVACEISALATFRAARRRGLITLLDAPSLHHAAQDRLHGTTDPPALHRRIVRIKDTEIALADHILTVSDLARDTYLAAGVPAAKVHAVPLGADLDLFTPAPGTGGSDLDLFPPGPHTGGTGDGAGGSPFVFLFCGAAIRRKGYDLLLDAFERVAAHTPDVLLRTAGPPGDVDSAPGPLTAARLRPLGPLPQPALAAELRRADCLVLPSRNDSYAMVVPEALASGLPVLISDMVGAAPLVTPGLTGWIVPAGDGPALARQMAWCAEHRPAVRGLRDACRAAAAAATWPAYYARLTALVRRLLPPPAEPAA